MPFATRSPHFQHGYSDADQKQNAQILFDMLLSSSSLSSIPVWEGGAQKVKAAEIFQGGIMRELLYCTCYYLPADNVATRSTSRKYTEYFKNPQSNTSLCKQNNTHTVD